MPRLETLKQNVRTQVSNPTPIASPEAARVAGEGMTALGRQLEGTLNAIQDVYVAAGQEEKKVRLGTSKIDADVYRSTALKETENSTDPLGRDKMDLFSQSFDKAAAQRLAGEKDDSMRKAMALQFYEEKAKGIIELNRQAPLDAANGINSLREANVNARLSSTRNDILNSGKDYGVRGNSWQDHINQNTAELQALNSTYHFKDVEKMARNEAEQIATAAIEAKISRRDYAGARDVISKTGQYLGSNISKFDDQVRQSERQDYSETITKYNFGEKVAEDNQAKKDNAIYAQSTIAMSEMDPSARVDYMATLNDQLASGDISPRAYKAAKASAGRLDKNLLPSQSVIDIISKIHKGEDVTELIQKEQSKEELPMSMSLAAQLFKIQNVTQAKHNAKNPMDVDKFKKSGQDLIQKSKNFPAPVQFQMLKDHADDAMNGKDPEDSMHRIVGKQAAKQIKTNRVNADNASQAIMVIDDVQSLQKMKPTIDQMVLQWRRAGKTKDALKLFRAFDEHMTLLGQRKAGEDNERKR